MSLLADVVAFLNEYLRVDQVEDDSWNGLQVEGKPTVNKIVLAVDASLDAFERAVGLGADVVIVHHGLFWRDVNPSMVGYNKQRLDILCKNSVSLYVAHVPLDCHPTVGNNVQLLNLIGAKVTGDFCSYKGKSISWIGELPQAIDLNTIVNKLNLELNTRCKVLSFGKSLVKTLAVTSGGGEYRHFYEAIDKGVDLYITGDTSEIYCTAKDAGINVIFAGHHATETGGLKALSDILRSKFKLETIFLDLPTGL